MTPPGSTARRELTVAVLLCLLGAVLVLVAAGRTWVAVQVLGGALTDDRTARVTGRLLLPGLGALGLVGLAGVVALAATRRWGRVGVGLLLLATGAGISALVLTADLVPAALVSIGSPGGGLTGQPATTGWPYVSVAGGLLLAAAGALVALRGRRWAALSQRYDAPAVRAESAAEGAGAVPDGPKAERALWDALDRGEDPTRR